MRTANERRRRRLVYGILGRIRLRRISRRYNPTAVLAVFAFISAGISITLIASLALLTHAAFIFPSLGATAFILFYEPTSSSACPRNTLLGHGIGAIAGWCALALFGLLDAPSALQTSVDLSRVGAVGLSLAASCALMVWFRANHPPAAATALIVSLGLMPQLSQIPVLLGGVILLLLQAWVMNHLAGIDFPLWSSRPDTSTADDK